MGDFDSPVALLGLANCGIFLRLPSVHTEAPGSLLLVRLLFRKTRERSVGRLADRSSSIILITDLDELL